LKWGHKHCEPGVYDALSKGNHHKTWWLYFGTVAPDQFRAIDYLAKNSDSHVVAVHEAGHAVAKVLAAGEPGYGINKAISHIDVGTGESLSGSGVTYGPVLSRDIKTASHEFEQSFVRGRGTLK